jgi:hypothetical protein
MIRRRAMRRPATTRSRGLVAAALVAGLLLAGCSRPPRHQTVESTLTGDGYVGVTVTDLDIADGHQITVSASSAPVDQDAAAAADRAAGVVWQEWIGDVALVRVVAPGFDHTYSASDLSTEFGGRPSSVEPSGGGDGSFVTIAIVVALVVALIVTVLLVTARRRASAISTEQDDDDARQAPESNYELDPRHDNRSTTTGLQGILNITLSPEGRWVPADVPPAEAAAATTPEAAEGSGEPARSDEDVIGEDAFVGGGIAETAHDDGADRYALWPAPDQAAVEPAPGPTDQPVQPARTRPDEEDALDLCGLFTAAGQPFWLAGDWAARAAGGPAACVGRPVVVWTKGPVRTFADELAALGFEDHGATMTLGAQHRLLIDPEGRGVAICSVRRDAAGTIFLETLRQSSVAASPSMWEPTTGALLGQPVPNVRRLRANMRGLGQSDGDDGTLEPKPLATSATADHGHEGEQRFDGRSFYG